MKLFADAHQPLATAPLPSLSATDQLAAALVKVLPTRALIGVVGTLGAGKTRLTQGLAKASGVPAGEVTSPTFTLVHRYQADRVLYHIDAYRIADTDEFWELGVDEIFEEEALTVIEWADRMASELPAESLWIEISIADKDNGRTVSFSGEPDRWSRLLQTIPMLTLSAVPDR